MKAAAIIFDVDGVLIDSFSAHLEFTKIMVRKYHLHLEVPTPERMKEIIRAGATISPMKNFFLSLGFSPVDAIQADQDYRKDFMRTTKPEIFNGTEEMLRYLASAGYQLGIVTSNTTDNITSGLNGAMKHFNPRCIFAKDHEKSPRKPEALAATAEILEISPSDIIYIGDQPQDADAANKAGTQFIGVTYGWGIANGDNYRTADNPLDIIDQIFRD